MKIQTKTENEKSSIFGTDREWLSPAESNPKERKYEVHSGVESVKKIYHNYIYNSWLREHTLRASSEENLRWFSLLEWNRGYTSSLNKFRDEVFLIYKVFNLQGGINNESL